MLANHSQNIHNPLMRSRLVLIISVTMILSGCTFPRSISAADFESFYADFTKLVSVAELKSRDKLDNQEILETYINDYQLYASEVEKITTQFSGLAKEVSPEAAKSFLNANRVLLDLRTEFLSEIKYLDGLNCPLSWDDSKRKEIEICGRATLRWAYSTFRAIRCTYHFAALELQNIPEFDRKKVPYFLNHTDKELKSCELFKNSNSLFGYPSVVGVTWIPERYQAKFLDQDQMFVVEIAQNLFTTKEEDLLTDALYGSWNGSCAVYGKYERLLLDGGYLLGSIKNGTCY